MSTALLWLIGIGIGIDIGIGIGIGTGVGIVYLPSNYHLSQTCLALSAL